MACLGAYDRPQGHSQLASKARLDRVRDRALGFRQPRRARGGPLDHRAAGISEPAGEADDHQPHPGFGGRAPARAANDPRHDRRAPAAYRHQSGERGDGINVIQDRCRNAELAARCDRDAIDAGAGDARRAADHRAHAAGLREPDGGGAPGLQAGRKRGPSRRGDGERPRGSGPGAAQRASWPVASSSDKRQLSRKRSHSNAPQTSSGCRPIACSCGACSRSW